MKTPSGVHRLKIRGLKIAAAKRETGLRLLLLHARPASSRLVPPSQRKRLMIFLVQQLKNYLSPARLRTMTGALVVDYRVNSEYAHTGGVSGGTQETGNKKGK